MYRIYDILCGPDEDGARGAMTRLIACKGASHATCNGTRRSRMANDEGTARHLMNSALMLRKLQAAAVVATGEGAKRARARLEEGGKALEHAGVVCFDSATQRCQASSPDSDEHASALLDMRAAADALLYYNGGATMMQRYVSTRTPFMDADVLNNDRKAVDNVVSHDDAVTAVQTLVEDMVRFVQQESIELPHIFGKHDTVMMMLLERLCYERLAPMLEGVLHRLDLLLLDQCACNKRLDCFVRIVRWCGQMVTTLETGLDHSGPLADKEARHEIAQVLDDLLAPFVEGFVASQLEVLQKRLDVLLPNVSSALSVQYTLRHRHEQHAHAPDTDFAHADAAATTVEAKGSEKVCDASRQQGIGHNVAASVCHASRHPASRHPAAHDPDGHNAVDDDDKQGIGHNVAASVSVAAAVSDEAAVSHESKSHMGGGLDSEVPPRVGVRSGGALGWAEKRRQEVAHNLSKVVGKVQVSTACVDPRQVGAAGVWGTGRMWRASALEQPRTEVDSLEVYMSVPSMRRAGMSPHSRVVS